jgi:two-component system, LuxR family, response regulator FixJ
MAKKDKGFDILVVDDDDAVRDSLKVVLNLIYGNVQTFGSGAEFLAVVHRECRACLILDIHMPDMSGIEVMQELSSRAIRLPTIMITGKTDSSLRSQAEVHGAIALLDKPLDHEKLIAAIELGRDHLRALN